MNKRLVFKIFLLAIILIFLTSLAFHFFYFKNFSGDTRPVTEEEKILILDILNQSGGEYQVEFGKVYTTDEKEIANIRVIKNNTKRQYFIDLKEKRIVKK